MKLAEIESACGDTGLTILGAFHPIQSDQASDHCKTLVLLGPNEPIFWQTLKSSPEHAHSDPVDKWSTRVIDGLADQLGAHALFPFGGPPYQPFIAWALRTGRVWPSPVSLLVHDRAGLFLSFRGALAFDTQLALPDETTGSPCDTCVEKPCKTACPVDALNHEAYNVDACHQWLDQKPDPSCLSAGCLARRACPISKNYGRLEEQSAHHMRAFHRG